MRDELALDFAVVGPASRGWPDHDTMDRSGARLARFERRPGAAVPPSHPQALPRRLNDRTMPSAMVKVVSQTRVITVG
ncbi:MAG: hypothetical protein QOD93_2674, partial [Acetobacteraceae bacterium]|nr:hypothetical protein [Acetobacteraceae bacterium]